MERGWGARAEQDHLLSRILPGPVSSSSRALRSGMGTLDGLGSTTYRRQNPMSQRKLIVSLTIAILLAVSAGVSPASLSRMEGMGLDVPLLSQFTDDYANIYTYPTSVVRQNNLVLAELGTNSFNDGEINEVATDDQSYTVIRN